MKKYVVFFCVVFGWLIGSSAEARDDGEWWNGISLTKSVHETFDLKASGENKLKDDLGNHYVTNGVVGVAWKPTKFFSLGLGYKFEHEEKSTGKYTDEHRPFMDVGLQTSLESLKVSTRYRLERRFLTDDGFFRHRGLLKFAHPVTLSVTHEGLKTTPFVSDEIFYDASTDQFNQNRFSIGTSQKLTDQLGLDLFYMIKSSRSGNDWNDSHILGTYLKVSF